MRRTEWTETPKKLFSLGFVLLAVAWLSGCANTTITSNVERFHRLPVPAAARTFAIQPAEGQAGSLEFAGYADAIARKLETYGWRQVTADKAPEYFVAFAYGIDNGETSTGFMPVLQQTGGGTANTSGTFNAGGTAGSFNSTTTTMPTFSLGSVPVRTTEYTRLLSIVISEAGAVPSSASAPNRVFEGRARSRGSISQLSPVMPYLIDALFQDFPGQSGKSLTVEATFRD